MRVVTSIVAFNTFGWMYECLRSYRKVFPKHEVIIVDNNLLEGQVPTVGNWNYGLPSFNDMQIESAWLKRRKDITLLEPPKENGLIELSHGHGIDFAVEWCRVNSVDVMVHIEPDCLFYNKAWYELAIAAINDGFHATGCHKHPGNSYSPVGSAYRVDKLESSFKIQPISKTAKYYELVLESERYPTWKELWDTGEKIWFDKASAGSFAALPRKGMWHFGAGSQIPKRPTQMFL